MNAVNTHRGNSPVLEYLQKLHEKLSQLHEGEVATYIPELAKANPDGFGICLVTAGGSVYEVGDSRQEFTIQSISKPFVYGMALEDHGRTDVLKKVGVEPSGDAFNAISLDPLTGRPRNPMINAGAIATTGLIQGKSEKSRLERILQTFGLYTGREMQVDSSVYGSESATGHRNRAIGHLLRNFDIITEDPAPVVDLYFRQCSILVTCRDLATMAATLANHGVNPVTGKRAIRGEYVESVLSVMGSCGMYDSAGEWVYKIGIPAKSGVAGGIIAVLPGQLGIGVFSPRLDAHGNSVRGIRVGEELSRAFNLHLFNPPQKNESAIRFKFTGSQVNSNRMRTETEMKTLRAFGSAIVVYELQGKMAFATAEVVLRDVIETMDHSEYFILDLKHVASFDECACRFLDDLLTLITNAGKTLMFTNAAAAPNLRRFLKSKYGEQRYDEIFPPFDSNDMALEWCENRIIEEKLLPQQNGAALTPADYELLAGLRPAELDVIEHLLERRTYAKGDVIIHAGHEATDLFFLARGSVSVNLTLPSGGERRLATFSPGMAFGEMAVIDGARRSATILADGEVECDLLKVSDFHALTALQPRIKIAILTNLAASICGKLRKANRELGVFDH